MDNVDPNRELDRLSATARSHYNAARWEEALGAIAQIQALGFNATELDDLVNDIKLKQRIEAVQVTSKAPPKRGRGFILPLVAISAGLTLVAATALVLGPLLTNPAPQPQVADLSRSIVGALPTVAPTEAPSTPVPAEPVVPVLTLGALTVAGGEGAASTIGVNNVYIILDGSGSMLARIGEQRKIDIAQESLVSLVDTLPNEAQVMLRTYGRRRPDDCGDIELVAAQPAPLDRATLIAKIEAIEPVNLSRTPIAASLAATAKDLQVLQGETLVVLVSDGEESCDGDPIAAAAAIHQARPDVRVSVVGFDIAPELREQLAGIAVAGGGIYVDATDVSELKAALNRVTALSFRVIDDAGSQVATGLLGERLELPTGIYTVIIGDEATLLEQRIEVRAGRATSLTIDEGAGGLTAEVRSAQIP